jgi:hypothetical protein
LATLEHAPPRRALNGGTPEIVTRGYRTKPTGWLSWLTTVDHKRIGIMYLAGSMMFFCLGGVEALLMRTQLAKPENTVVSPHTYDGLVTMHGTTMVFLFAMPIIAAFANYLIPLMVGARDMAFPRLNALSLWLFLAGGIVLYTSMDPHGPPDRHLDDVGRDQLHRDDPQHACARHVVAAHAALRLDDPRLLVPRGASAAVDRRGGDDVALRPPLRDLVLRDGRRR